MIWQTYCKKKRASCLYAQLQTGTLVLQSCHFVFSLRSFPPEPPPAEVPFSPPLAQLTGPCSGRGPWGSPFCLLLLTVLLTHKPTLQWKPLAAKSQDKEEKKIILCALSHSPNLLLLFKVWPTKWGRWGTMQRKSTSPEGEPTDPISERATSKLFSCSSALHCDSLLFKLQETIWGRWQGNFIYTLNSSKASESSNEWNYKGHRIIPDYTKKNWPEWTSQCCLRMDRLLLP